MDAASGLLIDGSCLMARVYKRRRVRNGSPHDCWIASRSSTHAARTRSHALGEPGQVELGSGADSRLSRANGEEASSTHQSKARRGKPRGRGQLSAGIIQETVGGAVSVRRNIRKQTASPTVTRIAGTKWCQRWVERLTADAKSGSTPICFSMMLTAGSSRI